MKKYEQKLVKEINRTELDLEHPFYENGGEERNEVETPNFGFSEVPSISIDEVIDILNNLKNSGADRVCIAEHCDHHGYYFYGIKLTQID
jgi:hypothetical protein